MKTLKEILKMGCAVCLAAMLLVGVAQISWAQEEAEVVPEPEKILKEVIVELQPNIIVLPQGEAARVPIDVARIRSTEIREINEEFNAVAIEKVYKEVETGPKSNKPAMALKSGEKKKEKEFVLAGKFTKETKKAFEKEGKQTAEIKDTFIIQFALEPQMSIMDVIVEYIALPVVVHIEEVVVTRE